MKVFTGRCRSCGEIIAASTNGDKCGEWLEGGFDVSLVYQPVCIGGHSSKCPEIRPAVPR